MKINIVDKHDIQFETCKVVYHRRQYSLFIDIYIFDKCVSLLPLWNEKD